MTNTVTSVDDTLDKPNAYNLKTRIKYMIMHLTSTIINLFGLFIGVIYNNLGMAVFNALLGLFNIYFFYSHYDKLINAIEQLTPKTVSLEKN